MKPNRAHLVIKIQLFFLSFAIQSSKSIDIADVNFLLLTVSTDPSCEFRQLNRSAYMNGIPLKVLGLGTRWQGFGHKLALLRDELDQHKHVTDKIIMYTDAYDVLINGRVDEIVDKFHQLETRLLFSAEFNCWPDKELCKQVPNSNMTMEQGKPYLNSGLFMGYAPELYEAINTFPFNVTDVDDQRYFYQIYTNQKLREDLHFKLDHRCSIFQTMEGGPNPIDVTIKDGTATIINSMYGTRPLVIHMPGYCSPLVNILGHYLPRYANQVEPIDCLEESKLDLDLTTDNQYPTIMISIIVDMIRVDLVEFFNKLDRITYPKDKIHLHLRYGLKKRHVRLVEDFAVAYGKEYRDVTLDRKLHKTISFKNDTGFHLLKENQLDFYLNFNAASLIDEPGGIRDLVTGRLRLEQQLRTFETGKRSPEFVIFLSSAHETCSNYFKILSGDNLHVVGFF